MCLHSEIVAEPKTSTPTKPKKSIKGGKNRVPVEKHKAGTSASGDSKKRHSPRLIARLKERREQNERLGSNEKLETNSTAKKELTFPPENPSG